MQNWHIVSPRYIFSSRGRTPWVILTVKWDAVSGTDPRLRAKFQPNPFRSLRADASQTDRHTSYPQLLRQIWSFTTQGTNNHEIMRSSVTGSAQTLVFLDQPSYPRSQGTPTVRGSKETGVGKNSEKCRFSTNNRYTSVTVHDMQILQCKTNRKPHSGFWLVPILMTVNNNKRSK